MLVGGIEVSEMEILRRDFIREHPGAEPSEEEIIADIRRSNPFDPHPVRTVVVAILSAQK